MTVGEIFCIGLKAGAWTAILLIGFLIGAIGVIIPFVWLGKWLLS